MADKGNPGYPGSYPPAYTPGNTYAGPPGSAGGNNFSHTSGAQAAPAPQYSYPHTGPQGPPQYNNQPYPTHHQQTSSVNSGYSSGPPGYPPQPQPQPPNYGPPPGGHQIPTAEVARYPNGQPIYAGNVQAVQFGAMYGPAASRAEVQRVYEPPGRFSSELCDCFADCNVCIMGWCCLPFVWAETATRIGSLTKSTANAIAVVLLVMSIVGSFGSNFVPGLQALQLASALILFVLGCRTRQELRRLMRMPEQNCEDCITWWFCSWCAGCQEARHIKHFRHDIENLRVMSTRSGGGQPVSHVSPQSQHGVQMTNMPPQHRV